MEPNQTYYYQMTEAGEIKSFVAVNPVDYVDDDSSDPDIPVTTIEPTANPTSTPIIEPTTSPTTEPTATPTINPTVEPTVEPTIEPTVEPTSEPIIKPNILPFAIQNVDVSSGIMVANLINQSDIEKSGILIFAAYSDNGTLVAVQAKPIESLAAGSLTPCGFAVPDNSSKYKLFVWNSYQYMIPLSESVTIE